MKLYDIDIGDFMQLLDRAKGDVILETDDGNKLNLKSKLCQLYGVKQLLESAKNATITAEIKLTNPEDQILFLKYLTDTTTL